MSSTAGGQPVPSAPGHPRGHDFPRFGESYRQQWVEAGLWADETLHELFDRTVEARPDEIAVITTDRRVTYAELKAGSDALAAGLLGAGVEAGDIVAVQLPNWVEFAELQIALSRIGAVIQPVHTVFRARELAKLLGFCQTDWIVTPGVIDGHDYAGVIRGIAGDLPWLKGIFLARSSEGGDVAPSDVGPELVSLEQVREDGDAHLERLRSLHDDPDAVFYLNFTSGTEGDPKGFLHTHNTLISTFKVMSQALAAMDPEAVNLACSPMTHSFGHFTTYQCALAGIPMVLVDRYRPQDVLELVQSEGVTAISGTPAHFIGILHHPDFAAYDTSSIRSASVGGARSAPELLEELQAAWGTKSANTYGMGENIIHTRTMPWDPPEKADSVGQPLFGAQLKILDPEDHTRELGPGEVGDIMFRGPTLFVGYHRQPELTAATRDDEGWFTTGDLGWVDDDGYLFFASRAKEVINRGGTKLYPKAVEDVLLMHPAIEDAAVVGMPDERMGERVCAYVILRAGADAPDRDELRRFFEEQGAMKYLVPDRTIVVEELPMTPTGKVAKAALKDDAARRIAGDDADERNGERR
jgi:acyl-CoA synthetase (AMP-forming)/AMP-acid ligase II